jgi:hypothetical protein
MYQLASTYQVGGRGNIYAAYAIVTAPVIYSTAANTGGPLLWNGSSGNQKVNAFLLSVTFGLSVASTVAGALGLTGNTGQSSAPGSTTAIDAVANLTVGGQSPACTAYRIGTPTNPGNFFVPIGMVHTGALTVDTVDENYYNFNGAVVVPPGAWVSLAGSATLTTAVMQIGLIWAEVPF